MNHSFQENYRSLLMKIWQLQRNMLADAKAALAGPMANDAKEYKERFERKRLLVRQQMEVCAVKLTIFRKRFAVVRDLMEDVYAMDFEMCGKLYDSRNVAYHRTVQASADASEFTKALEQQLISTGRILETMKPLGDEQQYVHRKLKVIKDYHALFSGVYNYGLRISKGNTISAIDIEFDMPAPPFEGLPEMVNDFNIVFVETSETEIDCDSILERLIADRSVSLNIKSPGAEYLSSELHFHEDYVFDGKKFQVKLDSAKGAEGWRQVDIFGSPLVKNKDYRAILAVNRTSTFCKYFNDFSYHVSLPSISFRIAGGTEDIGGDSNFKDAIENERWMEVYDFARIMKGAGQLTSQTYYASILLDKYRNLALRSKALNPLIPDLLIGKLSDLGTEYRTTLLTGLQALEAIFTLELELIELLA